MGNDGEEAKDPLKDVDWKNMGGGVNTNDKAEKWPTNPGVGAGMLLEVWINKKVREDGGVIWEFDK
ncbi:DNA-directed RNA polymerase subunit gamma [Bienertia sinuspersici]